MPVRMVVPPTLPRGDLAAAKSQIASAFLLDDRSIQCWMSRDPGRAVPVDPMKPTFDAPGTKRLKLAGDKTALQLCF